MSPIRTLAAAQLRADLRNPSTGRRAGGRIVMTFVAYAISGGVLALALGDVPPQQMLFVAGSFGMLLAAFGVVGSYDDLMGRPKDNAWLATLPATEAQHYAARLLGIAAYVALMALGVALPVGVRAAWSSGPLAGVLLGLIIGAGMVWTSALCVASLWGVTLSVPSRVLRPALSALRTLLVGALFIGYQWIGTEPEAEHAPWWPGAWLADALAGRPSTGLLGLVLSGGALLVALGAVFPRRYFRLLDRLAHGVHEVERRGRAGRRLGRAEQALLPPGPARGAYGFAVAAMHDDRLVAGRLWPAALLPVGFVLFGWLSGGLVSLFDHSAAAVFTEPATALHVSVLVVLLFCAQTLVQTLQHSDHAAAAWIFQTLPAVRPRALQVGAQTALAVRVLLPMHVVMAALLVPQMPPADAFLHALFWLAVTVVATRLFALAYRTPPFSRHGERFGAGARLLPLFVSVPGALLALGVQTFAFTTRPRALAVSLALLLAVDLTGRWTTRRRTRPSSARPTAGPAAPLHSAEKPAQSRDPVVAS